MTESAAADTIDVGNVFRTLRRGWRIIACVTAAGVALAVLFLTLAPRRFDGQASILLRSGGSASASLLSQVQGLSGGLFSGGSGGGSPMETELEILSSRSVAGVVVDSLRLQGTVVEPRGVPSSDVIAAVALKPSFAPRAYKFQRMAASRPGSPAAQYSYVSPSDSGVLTAGTPAHLAVGNLTIAAAPSPAVPDKFELVLSDRDDAVNALLGHLTVSPTKGEVAEITYGAGDSLTAARVPNAIIATYMARRHTSDRGVDQRRVEFLTQKLDSLNGALATQEVAFKNQQESSGVMDASGVGQLEVQRASELRASLLDLESERTSAQKLIAGVNDHSIKARQIAAFPTFLKSPGVNSILTQLMSVQSQRDALLGTRTAKDPQVQALDQAETDLENQLLPITETYVASLGSQQQQLQASLDSLHARIATLPATALAAGRLQRDVINLSKLSAGVQAQLVDAKLAAIGEGGDVHPLDMASVPRLPAFPKRTTTLAVGLMGGLALGTVAVLLLAAFGRWVQDPFDVERTTGVPALRFDPTAPLLVRGSQWRSILVAPVDDRVSAAPIAARLLATALASGISATVLDLTNRRSQSAAAGKLSLTVERRTSPESRQAAAAVAVAQTDVNAEIARAEQEFELVIVQLSGLLTDSAAAALRENRPVLLVTADRRIERSRLTGAVQLLKRLDVPCAGIVMNGETKLVAVQA